MKTIVLITGGFDPIHSGHIAYIREAKKLGDYLIVGANSDGWLTRKKGTPFMPLKERQAILAAIKEVDEVIVFNDADNSAKDAILQVRERYPSAKIVFGNGGDRTKTNIPEMDLPEEHLPFVEFVFGVGGEDKKNSSSWILEKWKVPKTKKPWGNYSVLHENGNHTKVKELVVLPHNALSMQVHKHRAEHWFVSEGTASVYTLKNTFNVHEPLKELIGVFKKHEYLHIDLGQWHMLANETDSILKIVEIQYGENCIEEDIERKPI